jgi:spore maturation protein CgeB
MTAPRLDIVILGLSLSSSWGNGHATTYRGLVRELVRRGHRVTFLERDVPWYAENRDLPRPPFGEFHLYQDLEELTTRWTDTIRAADLVVVGSYVPDGIEVGRWALDQAGGRAAFYDIDTPVTLAALEQGTCAYLAPGQIAEYNLYYSFAGGPSLRLLEERYGAPRAVALYCSFDPELYFPESAEARWDLGYMGTYSPDRQPPLDRLMLEPARRWKEGRFVVAGPQYPDSVAWPDQVDRREHLPPSEHRAFYCAQRFTLNVTRADMVRAGWSPSVRLFEAAACGVPIISDWWEGLDSLFQPDKEILISRSPEDTLRYLRDLPESERRAIAERARRRVLADHSAARRAEELEQTALGRRWLTPAQQG